MGQLCILVGTDNCDSVLDCRGKVRHILLNDYTQPSDVIETCGLLYVKSERTEWREGRRGFLLSVESCPNEWHLSRNTNTYHQVQEFFLRRVTPQKGENERRHVRAEFPVVDLPGYRRGFAWCRHPGHWIRFHGLHLAVSDSVSNTGISARARPKPESGTTTASF